MVSKNKIAIIGLKGLPAFGGSARATNELVKRLRNKYDITIYTVDTHSNKELPYDNVNQVMIHGYKSKRINTLLYYIKSLFHSLFSQNYDLVHTQHLYSGFLIPFLKLKYKVITTVRGIIPRDDNKWNRLDKAIFKIFERLALLFSDVVVSVAEPHITYLQQYGNKKIFYIPNGIDTGLSEKFIYNTKENYLLFAAARIIKLKGCHIFLEGLQKINYTQPVYLIGDIEQVQEYKKYIEELSKNLNVTFLGLIKSQEELYRYISKSKLFIFPSFNEGMSNMLLEAASLKANIIASDIQENKAVFSNEEVLYFETGDSGDLASKIKWALSNEGCMQQKAENAFEKLKTKYNWDNIARQYEELYDSLLFKK